MKKYLGIEFGSTRIKAVLVDERGKVLAVGNHEWKNELVGGHWSYDLDEVWKGLRSAYEKLNEEHRAIYGEKLRVIDGAGISGMMHGYLAFDDDMNLLTPFRTWRNTDTAEAAAELSRELNFNMPLRWSASHYYSAVLKGEPHLHRVAHLFTLSSYVHFMLTGENVVGANDASGMFPLCGGDYDAEKLAKFDAMLAAHGMETPFSRLLPKVKLAGERAGFLTKEGAQLIDPEGTLACGVPMCPPEGDMGTGMVATDSLAALSANLSSGTSANMTVIVDRPLPNVYPEIDIVAAPDGATAALIHTNNCTGDIDDWAGLFGEVARLSGAKIDASELMSRLFKSSTASDDDIGGLVGYNFIAAEPFAGTTEGRPLTLRDPDGKLTLANFMQSLIYSANAALILGTDILRSEGVAISGITAHGGFFKTERVGQNAASAMFGVPVTVMENAGEGGAWGMALLALYADNTDKSLKEFIDEIFRGIKKNTVVASNADRAKFAKYMQKYRENLSVARLAASLPPNLS